MPVMKSEILEMENEEKSPEICKMKYKNCQEKTMDQDNNLRKTASSTAKDGPEKANIIVDNYYVIKEGDFSEYYQIGDRIGKGIFSLFFLFTICIYILTCK